MIEDTVRATGPGHSRSKGNVAVLRNRIEPLQFRSRIGMIIDAEIQPRINVGPLYAQNKLLTPTLVATGILARLHGRNQYKPWSGPCAKME